MDLLLNFCLFLIAFLPNMPLQKGKLNTAPRQLPTRHYSSFSLSFPSFLRTLKMTAINKIQTKNTYIYNVGIPLILLPTLKIDNIGKLKSIKNNMLMNMSFCSFMRFNYLELMLAGFKTQPVLVQ